MSSNYRNNWVLCASHKTCTKCTKCINDWKKKSNQNGYSASRVKFVLDCILNDESTTYKFDVEKEEIPEMPEIKTDGKKIKNNCKICLDAMTIGGKKDMCCLGGCGHTICYECANNKIFRSKGECPYCRKEVKKIIKLYYDVEPTF